MTEKKVPPGDEPGGTYHDDDNHTDHIPDKRDLVDGDRTVCLCNVGSFDYMAATAVGADGDDEFWIVRKDMINRPDATFGNAKQPHEQLGRLPQEIRDAIWGDQLRCGRRTATTGRPCRVRVAKPGDACGHHAKAEKR